MSEMGVLEGDAIDRMRELAAETIDAVITDPPYCSGGWTEASRTRSAAMTRSAEGRGDWFDNDAMGTAGLIWLLRQMAIEAHRLLVPGGSLLLFCDWRMVPMLAPALESSGLRWSAMPVWDKGSAGMGSCFRPQYEAMLHFSKGTANVYDRGVTNVIRCNRVPPAQREHPTQKPVELMRALVRTIAPPGGLVLDPFAGSGSTGVACAHEGRRFLGVERDGRFVEVALQRTTGQGALFDALQGAEP